jgi:hypothetical protein
MAHDILSKYGIKEVADVMFYEIDSKGAPSAPVLYLDTLKVSTIEQSSETVDATGGKSNVKLLTWDTNKELTLTLEDALFSPKSLSIMFGGTITDNGTHQEVLKTLKADEFAATETSGMVSFKLKDATYYIDVKKISFYHYVTGDGTAATGNIPAGKTEIVPIPTTQATTAVPSNAEWGTFDLLDAVSAPSGGTSVMAKGMEINITAEFGDNTYYITGDTYARNYESGKDEYLQFIVPKGKVSAEDVSLTMEADGDPATFSMTVNCLKANDGSMLKLVKYGVGTTATATGENKGVASVLDEYNDNLNLRAPWADPNARIPGLA